MRSARRSPRTTIENRYAAVYADQCEPAAAGGLEEVFATGRSSFRARSGFKPELLAVMAMTENAPERLIVCNGFKDDSYIEAVSSLPSSAV